ncbi:photosystem II biogenesis protein Psp29 [Pantanalinema rosaneae CENA516]|uniref:photosystem II biogenesis protein Psp29 n=1 Tax=Pantanalinema rosaneae TaxID=1620701 RepID=UPI003D6F4CF4
MSAIPNSIVNNVRTVSDTKRAFYNIHTRPINSIYRRIVEELMVEMHLLAVNVDFRYDPLYALGVVTSFDRFMQGYRPEPDKASIFAGLCQALQDDPQRYRSDADRLRAMASSMSVENLLAWFGQAATAPTDDLQGAIHASVSSPNYKYSRLAAVGVFTLLELADPDLVKDDTRREEAIKQAAMALKLPDDKVQKDLELYRGNLDKLAQAQAVMEDILKADRKKREQQANATTSSPAAAPKDEAPSGS